MLDMALSTIGPLNELFTTGAPLYADEPVQNVDVEMKNEPAIKAVDNDDTSEIPPKSRGGSSSVIQPDGENGQAQPEDGSEAKQEESEPSGSEDEDDGILQVHG